MRPTSKLSIVTCLLAGSLALGGPAPGGAAGEEPEAGPPEAGWRVYIDPETGEVTSSPSPEQIEALSEEILAVEGRSKSPEALSRSDAGLVPFELRLGGRGVFLQGRFQSALAVRRLADGSFEPLCTDPEHAIETLADEPAPEAPPQWVEK